MSRQPERVVAFYNKRGTCEQWIKEGKSAIKWTLVTISTSRLSCKSAEKTRTLMPVWDSSGESRFIFAVEALAIRKKSRNGTPTHHG
jgi:hypothetical protein